MTLIQIKRIILKKNDFEWHIILFFFFVFIISYILIYFYMVKNLNFINKDDFNLIQQSYLEFYNTTEVQIPLPSNVNLLHKIPKYNKKGINGPGENGAGIPVNNDAEAQKLYAETMKKWFMNLIAR